MQLYDKYPMEFFNGSEGMKKTWLIDNIDENLIKSGQTEINSLIDSTIISSPSKDFCKACFSKAPKEFFYLPTSTTGKYHGGPESLENSIGGNIKHTLAVLNLAPKVIHRYKELTNYECGEMLKVSCILHDICKVNEGAIYSSSMHGEIGADLIATVECNHPIENFLQIVDFSVRNHMYLWKFQNVYNQIAMLGEDLPSYELIIGLMLSECDYYATPFGFFEV